MKDEKNNEIREILKEYNEDMKQYIDTRLNESEKKTQEYVDGRLDEAEKNMQRHTGALLEDFRAQGSGVAEGVMMLNEKVDRLENRVERIENHVERIENRLEHVENHLEFQETKLDEVIHTQEVHTEMIGLTAENVSEIKDEMKKKVDQTEFIGLKQRVLSLES